MGCIVLIYKEGERVFVFFFIRKKGLHEAFLHCWVGPFTILKQLQTNTYKLRRTNKGTTIVAHVIQIKPFFQALESRSSLIHTTKSDTEMAQSAPKAETDTEHIPTTLQQKGDISCTF